jgi:membrane protein
MNIKKEIVSLLKETWEEFQNDEAERRGAALAYYAMFSIFPLILLLLASLGFVLRYWDAAIDVQQEVLSTVAQHFSPQLGETLGQILIVLRDKAGPATGIGLVTLLIGASGVFHQMDQSLRKIWRVPQEKQPSGALRVVLGLVKDRVMSFGMVLALGLLLLISLALTGITQALLGALSHLPLVGGAAGFLVGFIVTLCLNTLIFALLFKYIPGARVRWRDIIPGALATALLWEMGKRALALYLQHSSYVNAYGAVGAAMALMVWVYFSSQILFFGAEFTEVYSRRYGTRPPQRPSPAASGQMIMPT